MLILIKSVPEHSPPVCSHSHMLPQNHGSETTFGLPVPPFLSALILSRSFSPIPSSGGDPWKISISQEPGKQYRPTRISQLQKLSSANATTQEIASPKGIVRPSFIWRPWCESSPSWDFSRSLSLLQTLVCPSTHLGVVYLSTLSCSASRSCSSRQGSYAGLSHLRIWPTLCTSCLLSSCLLLWVGSCCHFTGLLERNVSEILPSG